MSRRNLAHEVAQAAADTASPAAHREDEGRLPLGRDDDVRRSRRAVDEVPCGQLPLLVLDDERAFAGEDEEELLCATAMPDRAKSAAAVAALMTLRFNIGRISFGWVNRTCVTRGCKRRAPYPAYAAFAGALLRHKASRQM